ncbi:unknown [Firmicutes bacterium CAG:321]|nr:unknown [Firmicutes bacterium CAG:321]
MIKLTKEDILKNRVNTISQFMVLKYLKSCLNTDMFHFYLIKNGIKVVDNKEDTLYFYYDEMTKDVITSEESISFEKGIELEL